MKKAEQYIQSKYGRIASILPDWNDICNADMTKLKLNRRAARTTFRFSPTNSKAYKHITRNNFIEGHMRTTILMALALAVILINTTTSVYAEDTVYEDTVYSIDVSPKIIQLNTESTLHITCGKRLQSEPEGPTLRCFNVRINGAGINMEKNLVGVDDKINVNPTSIGTITIKANINNVGVETKINVVEKLPPPAYEGISVDGPVKSNVNLEIWLILIVGVIVGIALTMIFLKLRKTN